MMRDRERTTWTHLGGKENFTPCPSHGKFKRDFPTPFRRVSVRTGPTRKMNILKNDYLEIKHHGLKE